MKKYYVVLLLVGHSAKLEQIVIEDEMPYLKDEVSGKAYRYNQIGFALKKASMFGGRVVSRESSVLITEIKMCQIDMLTLHPNILTALKGREVYEDKFKNGEHIYNASLFSNMLINKAIKLSDEDIKQVEDIVAGVISYDYVQLIAA